MDWIRLRDKLPEDGQKILVFYNNIFLPMTAMKPPEELSYLEMRFIPASPLSWDEWRCTTVIRASDFEYWMPLIAPKKPE